MIHKIVRGDNMHGDERLVREQTEPVVEHAHDDTFGMIAKVVHCGHVDLLDLVDRLPVIK